MVHDDETVMQPRARLLVAQEDRRVVARARRAAASGTRDLRKEREVADLLEGESGEWTEPGAAKSSGSRAPYDGQIGAAYHYGTSRRAP